MIEKTKEQILAEMKRYRETATSLSDEDARRLAKKWAESDKGITPEVL